MFDGKTFFPVTGMPMRKIACMRRLFADAEPVPFGVAILKAKSLVRSIKLASSSQLPASSVSLVEQHATIRSASLKFAAYSVQLVQPQRQLEAGSWKREAGSLTFTPP